MTGDKPGDLFNVSIGIVQRLATRIVDMPPEKREAAYSRARRALEEMIVNSGGDLTGKRSQEWIELQVQGIRALVHESKSAGDEVETHDGSAHRRAGHAMVL